MNLVILTVNKTIEIRIQKQLIINKIDYKTKKKMKKKKILEIYLAKKIRKILLNKKKGIIL